MRRSHRIIFSLIALLALATFVFGVLQLVGAHRWWTSHAWRMGYRSFEPLGLHKPRRPRMASGISRTTPLLANPAGRAVGFLSD